MIDMGKVYRQTNLENLEQAFSVAERELGVTRLLDPEGSKGRQPASLSVGTRVQLPNSNHSHLAQIYLAILPYT